MSVALVRGSSAAQCEELVVVPLGQDSLKALNVRSCGSTAVIQAKPWQDIGTWYKPGFNTKDFVPVEFPMGNWIVCPEHGTNETLFSVPEYSRMLVRREFDIPANALRAIEKMTLSYVVDDHVTHVFVNGQRVQVGLRVNGDRRCRAFGCCERFGATNTVDIPVELLQPGKNLLAVQAMDTGIVAYLDLGLSFSLCSSAVAELHSCSPSAKPAGVGCQARCDEENYCRIKADEDCAASFVGDVSGSCKCESAESLSCSGGAPDAEIGVCYESTWSLSKISRVAYCPPTAELSCVA